MMQQQSLYPEPLRGTDGGYTYVSIVDRLSKIVRETAAKLQPHVYNSPAHFEAVKSKLITLSNVLKEKANEPPQPEFLLQEPSKITEEYLEWKECEEEFEFAKHSWLSISWLFLETFVYRKMLELVEYFDAPDGIRDPFELQKREALAQGLESLKQFSHATIALPNNNQKLHYLLLACLWGNQIDLSITSGVVNNNHLKQKTKDESVSHLVINDSDLVIEKFLKLKNDHVAFIVDNAGPEICHDMFLADALVEYGIAKQVTFYVKEQPVFVSDAMVKDFEYTIQVLSKCGDATLEQYAARFQSHLDKKQWIFKQDRFFTLPLPFWDMPQRVREQFAEEKLCIIKGDANYRKLINDLHWDAFKTSFHYVVKHYFPTSLVSLRTLKSESLVGLTTDERQAMVKELPEDWRITGNYGLVQYME